MLTHSCHQSCMVAIRKKKGSIDDLGATGLLVEPQEKSIAIWEKKRDIEMRGGGAHWGIKVGGKGKHLGVEDNRSQQRRNGN